MTISVGFIGSVGNTPLIRLGGPSEASGCEILGKAEFMNPGGSVKDRAARGIIEDAEKRGTLKPGGIVVEGTAGNTGIGLAHVCNERGYRCVIVMPDNQSAEKYKLLEMLGAEVHKVPVVPYSNPNQYQKVAGRLAESLPNAVWSNQFDNTANRDAHFNTTGPEIWEQTGGRVTAFTCASGTGGTFAGVSEFLKSQNAKVRCVLADPPGSSLYEYVKNGALKGTGSGSITEGIGIARITANMATAKADDAVHIEDAETVGTVYRLLRDDGLFLGSTSGINVAAAMRVARDLPPGSTVVTILCDGGARYQSRLFNPEWLAQKGLARAAAGTARSGCPLLWRKPLSPERTKLATVTDAVIVGAGPVGLFQVFELGLLGLRAELIDSLPAIGGQCTELYPDKPIYDIPAVPMCTARELIERLAEQIKPFNAGVHLGQEVTSVQRREDGRFDVETSRGTRFDAGTVIIAAGVGSFQPRRLSVPDADKHEGQSIHYRVKDAEAFRDKDLVILGGGDSALDWTLSFAESARSVVLVHRRADFRAAPASVDRMHALRADGRVDFLEGVVQSIVDENGTLRGVKVAARDGVTRTVSLDHLLVFWGLSPKLGPIANWGVALNRKTIPVDTQRFQTSVPGIYAIGDINDYPGKKKLILSGFHEAALAAFAIKEYLSPGQKVHLQYTTTSPLLQKRLGVTGEVGEGTVESARSAGG